MKKIGIVHAGGGAKGSFGIGVLDVLLKKIKDDGDRLEAVSGTSIGAMNMAFVVSGQFEELKNLWLSWDMDSCPLVQPSLFNPVLGLVLKGYMYDPEPTLNFFKKNLNVSDLQLSEIKYYNTRVRLNDGQLFYGGNSSFKTKERAIEEIGASMAFIPGTTSVQIDGEEYVDGGFRESVPAEVLATQHELDHIYVISLYPEKRPWDNSLTKNNSGSLLSRFNFTYNDIIWDEMVRSDIEIGKLKYWNPSKYTIIYPKEIEMSSTNFSKENTLKNYNHGIEIAKGVL
jgi:predicted acylesterase/phospholipase RssA